MITPGAGAGAGAEPWSLVTAGMGVLDTLGELILATDPDLDAEPADEETAMEAIRTQGELTLQDFLG